MDTSIASSVATPAPEQRTPTMGVSDLLRCPVCRSTFSSEDGTLNCEGCGRRFPVAGGVPILINESASLFRIDQIIAPAASPAGKPSLSERLHRRLPKLNCNYRARRNYEDLARQLLAFSPRPRVLIIGCGLMGAGISALTQNPDIELIESDICLGGRAKLVCDAGDLPLADGSLDGVVLQAVLDDLIDPHRCLDEIHRVLKPGGLVYVETPFMQPVHDGWRDFGRWSLLGHRRMLRMFEEVSSGAVGGPGMALALMYQAFLLSLVRSRAGRMGMTILARTTAWWLKYVDRLIIDRPAALDSASAVYFMGRKTDRPVSDGDLPKLYRGGQGGA